MGLSMADITNSVLTDKNKVHSVSTLAQVELPCFLSHVVLLSHGGATMVNLLARP